MSERRPFNLTSRFRLCGAVLLFALGSASAGAMSNAPNVEIVTLGTAAGPMANTERAQPATLLRWSDKMILVDAGEGVTEQMARAGIDAVHLKSVVLTHIHADHIGGLFALLARRFQLMDPAITIYGPPGTKEMVDGLLAALGPLKLTSPSVPGQPTRNPADGVNVVEFDDGGKLTIEGIEVRAAANTHYVSDDHALDSGQPRSLALRFELPGRSVVMTGDTGPSARVTELARHADVLVSSILDIDAAVATIRASRPGRPSSFYDAAKSHFVQHHLSPEAVGRLAQAAGVKRVVLTHIGISPAQMSKAKSELNRAWSGNFVFAHDLGRY